MLLEHGNMHLHIHATIVQKEKASIVGCNDKMTKHKVNKAESNSSDGNNKTEKQAELVAIGWQTVAHLQDQVSVTI